MLEAAPLRSTAPGKWLIFTFCQPNAQEDTDMAKKKKTGKRRKHVNRQPGLPVFQWMDNEGMHVAAPGLAPTPEQLQKMTEEYQQRIRNSPMWDMMVKEFGKENAEEMLKEFQVKFR